MTKQELFASVEMLIGKLAEHRKTGNVSFRDMDEKLELKKVYAEIYPYVFVEMSCPTCILSYLNHLESWYEREQPKYAATLQKEAAPAPTDKIQYQGIKQEPAATEAPIDEAPAEAPIKKAKVARAKEIKKDK